MTSIIKSLLSATPVKLALILAIVTALIAAKKWSDDQKFQAGYNAHKAETLDTVQKLQEQHAQEIDAAIAERDKLDKRAAALQVALREKPKVVYKDVVKVIESANCVSLGADFVSLHNDWVEWANSGIEPRDGSGSD